MNVLNVFDGFRTRISLGKELDREGQESVELRAQLAQLQKRLDEFDVSTDSPLAVLFISSHIFPAKVLAGADVVARVGENRCPLSEGD